MSLLTQGSSYQKVCEVAEQVRHGLRAHLEDLDLVLRRGGEQRLRRLGRELAAGRAARRARPRLTTAREPERAVAEVDRRRHPPGVRARRRRGRRRSRGSRRPARRGRPRRPGRPPPAARAPAAPSAVAADRAAGAVGEDVDRARREVCAGEQREEVGEVRRRPEGVVDVARVAQEVLRRRPGEEHDDRVPPGEVRGSAPPAPRRARPWCWRRGRRRGRPCDRLAAERGVDLGEPGRRLGVAGSPTGRRLRHALEMDERPVAGRLRRPLAELVERRVLVADPERRRAEVQPPVRRDRVDRGRRAARPAAGSSRRRPRSGCRSPARRRRRASPVPSSWNRSGAGISRIGGWCKTKKVTTAAATTARTARMRRTGIPPSCGCGSGGSLGRTRLRWEQGINTKFQNPD